MPPPRINPIRPGARAAPAPKRSLLDRIQPIQFTDDDGIKVLLYGVSGTGKTTIASTFPAPLLWMSVSGGKKPGELRSVYTAENQGRIKEFKLEDSGELVELAENHASSFRTLVLDHATGYQDMILKEVCGLTKIPEQKGWGTASQQQYGTISTQFRENLRALLSVAQNVVIVAHQKTFGGEGEGSDVIEASVGAALMPSLTNWTNGAVDYIMQTFKRSEMRPSVVKIAGKEQTMLKKTGRVEYCLRMGPHATYQTKFRAPKGFPLPDILIDPDYDKIVSVIRGEFQFPDE